MCIVYSVQVSGPSRQAFFPWGISMTYMMYDNLIGSPLRNYNAVSEEDGAWMALTMLPCNIVVFVICAIVMLPYDVILAPLLYLITFGCFGKFSVGCACATRTYMKGSNRSQQSCNVLGDPLSEFTPITAFADLCWAPSIDVQDYEPVGIV
eukprot:TRINITY_DN14115_c0_g1_i1.p1 TRINITY_DN14115_c0_g1~~TRINITY_DN14115_c0_g1_i1.p1  ORF type:complete len:151 (+),score=14.73 TRINITY_DN14115_c0_g1_i1:166-618(+)